MLVASSAVKFKTVATPASYPTLQGVLPRHLTLHDTIMREYVVVPNCELVVSILLHDSRSLWLVESAKQPNDSHVLTFPQETIKFGRDGTFRSTLIRGLCEELRVTERLIRPEPVELFRFENHLPLTRTDGVPTTKVLFYFAAKVPTNTRFNPNPAEVRRVVEVTPDTFLDLACGCRRDKCAGQIEAVLAAIKANVLNAEHWAELASMYRTRPHAH